MKKLGQAGAGWRGPLSLPALFLLCMLLGGVGYFEVAPPERTCVSCHEIQASHRRWTNSVHRAVSCKACHGGSADSWHALKENAKRVFFHLTEDDHSDMRLSEEQTVRMVRACQACHVREYAHWLAGGHGASYAAIFADETHNRTEQVNDDCLRCHGMFFEGRASDLLAPLDTRGPWRFLDPRQADRPAVPCLACHELHAPGKPFARELTPAGVAQAATNAPCAQRDTVAFYVRQEHEHFAIDKLGVPRIVDPSGMPVRVSHDPRQRLCTQCHAPNAFGVAGTGDDRTPTGVHEGLSCAACHRPHSNDAHGSCALCHPARSSCGLAVTDMDTTYRSKTSRHNIHRVKCLDCHPDGVPKRPGKPTISQTKQAPSGRGTFSKLWPQSRESMTRAPLS